MKSDDRDQSYAQKTDPQPINMFGPEPGADDRPTDITLRSRAALRVMWTTDVRQHAILVDFRVICWHQRAVHMEISRFHNFSPNENPENQPVTSYNPVELRKSRSDEKIMKYWISWITDGKNHEIWPEAFSHQKCPSSPTLSVGTFPLHIITMHLSFCTGLDIYLIYWPAKFKWNLITGIRIMPRNPARFHK